MQLCLAEKARVKEVIGPAKAALKLGKDSSREDMRVASKELLGLWGLLGL